MKSKRRKILLGGALCFLVVFMAAAAVLFEYNRFSLRISLEGETEMTLSYGEIYQEPGSRVFFQGSRFLTDPVATDISCTVLGEIPASKIGDFTLTYQAKKLWMKAEAVRTVHIVDRIPPEIQLVSNEKPKKGVVYQEEGFTATDNVDGDITDRVIRKEYEGEIHYTVQDSSGNETTVIRDGVTTFDITPPEIVLAGEAEMEISYGSVWQDPGYQAQDQSDGDLTEAVTVEGEIDPWLPGIYTLSYSVSDTSENMTLCTRKVTVAAAPRQEVIMPDKKTIYLTFDDGPGPYTNILLDILRQYGVKATFFVVGDGHAQQMQRIVREGHSIAVHSVTHNYKQIYASKEAYFQDMLDMQKIIEDNTGVRTTLLRFPGGGSNMVSSFTPGLMTTLTEAVQDAGFQYFDWNVDSNDAGGAKTPEEVFKNVTEGCMHHKVSVVLQHDIHPFSVAAVEKIIQWGQKYGYQFLPLTPNSYGAHHTVFN